MHFLKKNCSIRQIAEKGWQLLKQLGMCGERKRFGNDL